MVSTVPELLAANVGTIEQLAGDMLAASCHLVLVTTSEHDCAGTEEAVDGFGVDGV
jgi:predicted alpha/beta-hydrolase family hydrolase